jgi:hypothetical protein
VAKQVQRRAAVGRAVAGLVAGQGGAAAEIGADQERIDHAGGGAGVGQAFVAARREAGEGEGRAAQDLGHPGDLADVGGGVAPDPVGIAAVDRGDLGAGELLAIGDRDAQVAGDDLQAVAGQVAGREVVAQDRVEGVDQLAARREVAHRAIVDGVAAPGAAAEQARADPPERQRHAEAAGALDEERQVKAVEVVILEDIGICVADRGHQAVQERGLGGVAVAVGLEGGDRAVGGAPGDEEDPIAGRIEAGGLEVELGPGQVGEGQVAEVGAAAGD